MNLRRALILIAITAASALATLLLTADRLPPLDSDSLQAARDSWRTASVASYDLEIQTEGSELEPSVYVVEVRAGDVKQFHRDDRPASGDGTAYTVEGLFGMLARELELAKNPSRSYGAPAGYQAHLLARFDARGVPVGFRRVVGGNNRWAEWKILRFEPR